MKAKKKICFKCFTPFLAIGDGVCPQCGDSDDYADGYLDCWNELMTDDKAFDRLAEARQSLKESNARLAKNYREEMTDKLFKVTSWEELKADEELLKFHASLCWKSIEGLEDGA